MKKTLLALVLSLCLLLPLTACGSSYASTSSSSSSSSSSKDTAFYGDYEDNNSNYAYDDAYEDGYDDTPEYAELSSSSSKQTSDSKIIYTADLQIETTDFDADTDALLQLMSSLDGYLERSDINNYYAIRQANYTFRVPASNYATFVLRAGEIGLLKHKTESAENVSEDYYDTQSRLSTQQTKLSRLQELLAQAESLEDMITIESAISDTELAIERLTGTLRHYDALIGYSTVEVRVTETDTLVAEEQNDPSFGVRLSAAFRRGTESFAEGCQSFLLWVAENWGGILVFAAIIFVIVKLHRRNKQKRASQQAPRKPLSLFRKKDAPPSASAPEHSGDTPADRANTHD